MENIKIGILSPDYPNEKKMPFAFIHARAKLYLNEKVPVFVFVISNLNIHEVYEGVHIYRYNKKELRHKINMINPDVLAVHFPNIYLAPFAQTINLPKVAWIHGHEILWKPFITKTKNPIINIKKWIMLIPVNIIQTYRARRLIKNSEYVVFVSKWMKKTAEKHSLTTYKNAKVIPNPIDTDKFTFNPIENREKNYGISLRGFSNKKYGLDVAIEAFANQKDIKLDIVGTGAYRNLFILLKKKYASNVNIIEKVIPHSDIPDFYKPYGFFVAPSRREAQGVAMCEAMACGLPIITTKVGGIPEFVRDKKDGYLVTMNDSAGLIAAVKKLMNLSEDEYKKMSVAARNQVIDTCSSAVITSLELDILKEAIIKYNNKNS